MRNASRITSKRARLSGTPFLLEPPQVESFFDRPGGKVRELVLPRRGSRFAFESRDQSDLVMVIEDLNLRAGTRPFKPSLPLSWNQICLPRNRRSLTSSMQLSYYWAKYRMTYWDGQWLCVISFVNPPAIKVTVETPHLPVFRWQWNPTCLHIPLTLKSQLKPIIPYHNLMWGYATFPEHITVHRTNLLPDISISIYVNPWP